GFAPARSVCCPQYPVCRCPRRAAERLRLGSCADHRLPFHWALCFSRRSEIALSRELDQTYRAVAANLPNNPAARIEAVAGQDELVLTDLDKLEEPASL